MIQAQTDTLPTSFEEFLRFEPIDGFKYEWNDGELIRFSGVKRKHLRIIQALSRLFDKTFAHQQGGLIICEQDVMLTAIQMRRPDVAYFSDEQIQKAEEEEVIPAFCIEIISHILRIKLSSTVTFNNSGNGRSSRVRFVCRRIEIKRSL